MRHSNVAPEASEEKPNVASYSEVVPDGPLSIWVSGAAGSAPVIVQLRIAGVGSSLPARSRAVTEKVWSPGARPLYSRGEPHSLAAAPSSEHENDAPLSEAENE